jgi:hypothetical protein
MQHSRTVIPGRQTAELEQPAVLFLIGMRFNRFRTFSK